ncbi:MAG TPA: hypothetical protein VLV90_04520 [Burkholderiales bacterium]|nr:hypothetical protein [Burkholderiales bacterium]
MHKTFKRWALAAAALMLSGCAGTDFVRPDASDVEFTSSGTR